MLLWILHPCVHFRYVPADFSSAGSTRAARGGGEGSHTSATLEPHWAETGATQSDPILDWPLPGGSSQLRQHCQLIKIPDLFSPDRRLARTCGRRVRGREVSRLRARGEARRCHRAEPKLDLQEKIIRHSRSKDAARGSGCSATVRWAVRGSIF